MAEMQADACSSTVDPERLTYAELFCPRFVMHPLSGGEVRLDGLHDKTQIPKITGAEWLCELTGEAYFDCVAKNFWHFVVTNRTYAIGGNNRFPANSMATTTSAGLKSSSRSDSLLL